MTPSLAVILGLAISNSFVGPKWVLEPSWLKAGLTGPGLVPLLLLLGVEKGHGEQAPYPPMCLLVDLV